MLNNNRISLQAIEKKDILQLNKWKNDYSIFKFLGGGYEPQSISNLEKYMDVLCDNTGKNKRFIIKIKDKSIGVIGLYEIDNKNRICELGIYIGEKEEWGKGYAKEACQLIQEYAFLNLNLRKIKLLVVKDNRVAKEMYLKLGYRIVGTYYEERYIEGEYKDILAMELLREREK